MVLVDGASSTESEERVEVPVTLGSGYGRLRTRALDKRSLKDGCLNLTSDGFSGCREQQLSNRS